MESIKDMNSVGSIRIALLAVLLVYLSAHSYVALIGWVDSPIGTKDALIYEEIKFFPAVTICPIPDPEFEKVITFNSNSTILGPPDSRPSKLVEKIIERIRVQERLKRQATGKTVTEN